MNIIIFGEQSRLFGEQYSSSVWYMNIMISIISMHLKVPKSAYSIIRNS
jgi:hypothetical protein